MLSLKVWRQCPHGHQSSLYFPTGVLKKWQIQKQRPHPEDAFIGPGFLCESSKPVLFECLMQTFVCVPKQSTSKWCINVTSYFQWNVISKLCIHWVLIHIIIVTVLGYHYYNKNVQQKWMISLCFFPVGSEVWNPWILPGESQNSHLILSWQESVGWFDLINAPGLSPLFMSVISEMTWRGNENKRIVTMAKLSFLMLPCA